MVFLNNKSVVTVLAAVALSGGGVRSFAPSSPRPKAAHAKGICVGKPRSPLPLPCDSRSGPALPSPVTRANLFSRTKTDEPSAVVELVDESSEGDWIDESKKVELILLGIWGFAISAFIIVNDAYGPWPLVMKTVPERVYFLCHMIGGMLFGGGIILTTCIERLVAKSKDPEVLQFWFDKVPELDGLIVVPALTVSMISGTGLSIKRYGGLNVAPPHVDAIFWTLILFMSWWALTDLTTQASALKAVERMYDRYQNGEEGLETPKVVVDRHFSNVVSCFFILILYSFMVMKPGYITPWPWSH